jgi:hypothetical protein
MRKLRAEEPDTRNVEWLQGGARPMPLPRSIAHLKLEISEKKWEEALRWCETRVYGNTGVTIVSNKSGFQVTYDSLGRAVIAGAQLL